ncbi:MAG: type II toxin-antitoxin system HicB family antitoxin [Candidatus Tenebribacter davisii]|jgi:antitoxin HicB|nr:type II toxin-antitoxin system HicB family antitoxin [Candidatus Tenebribacter davisii]
MFYHFKVHHEDNGLWAECLELEGCNTQADDIDQLKVNMHQALNLYLSEPEYSQVLSPLPFKTTSISNIHQVKVDSKVALSFILRRHRILKDLSQSQVAEMLGLKNIYSYQRLEKSSTANPSLSTMDKLKDALPDLELNLIFK